MCNTSPCHCSLNLNFCWVHNQKCCLMSWFRILSLPVHFLKLRTNFIFVICLRLRQCWCMSSGFQHVKMEAYEGASKSSQTESIIKYMLTFVTGGCCHLQHSPLPSLCNMSSISVTAASKTRTDILESHVRRSEIVPEFQRHLEMSLF
jgi:hypothetical protein